MSINHTDMLFHDVRERSMLCGYFLSRFDRMALTMLGFETFREAYQVLGYGLGAKPTSIKNYRDEFDPVLSGVRTGWDSRPMRDHCKSMLLKFENATADEIAAIIRHIAFPCDAPSDVITEVAILEPKGETSFAKRLATGRAAESYFWQKSEMIFSGHKIEDATAWGCGFDFKLTPPEGGVWHAVEVKGVAQKCAPISLTSLEHQVATKLGSRYHLVIVYDFVVSPRHSIFTNPTCGAYGFEFKRNERLQSVITWVATLPLK